MKGKIVTGVDLGSSKIAVVTAQVNYDNLNSLKEINVIGVSSVSSKGIKRGQIVNIDETVEATIDAIEAAQRMAGQDISEAYISLGGCHISSQNSQGVVAVSGTNNEIIEGDIARSLEAASAISLPAGRKIIHVLAKEYIVDGEAGVKDPIGMTGVRLEVETHIVTASDAAINNITKTLYDSGVKTNDLVFSALASSYSTLTETEKELGCCLIDIGGGTTSVVVFIDGSICYSGVIPIGAKNITNDIAIGLKVSLESAEKIKLFLSKAKKSDKESGDELNLNTLGITEINKVSKKTLIEGIIRPRLNEIFTMVRLELEREKLLNRIPTGAIITGGGSKTVTIAESGKRMMTLPVRIGTPTGVGGLIDDISDPSYSNVVGLVLYGANNINSQRSSVKLPRINIPGGGLLHKLIETVKDLLP